MDLFIYILSLIATGQESCLDQPAIKRVYTNPAEQGKAN
jgi:hypothetical protein